jgi:uncharacterized protein (TIGR03437 family)
MDAKARIIAMAGLLAVYCSPVPGQATILEIDVENFVEYQSDVADPSKLATDPISTISVQPRNFFVATVIGDIVAVNGRTAKGTVVARARSTRLNPAGTAADGGPGAAIGDIHRVSIREQIFEILKSDGTPVGTIMAFGLASGNPPPGAPLAATGGNFAIVGGTGAFLGARGQYAGAASNFPAPRAASMAEDPSYRRVNGGGGQRFVLHVIPMSAPQIETTPSGPAVTHSSDFSLVSASKPAAAGEILSLFLTGLGPTVPGVDPGKPFPATFRALVNSPVDVTVNGKPAEVLGAVGFPGATDGYQVNFRVPPDTAPGTATIQVSAAWIAGPEVRMAIQ